MKRVVETGKTPEELYQMLDRAITNALRAGNAQVSPDFMDQMHVLERCVRIAVGMPVDDNS